MKTSELTGAALDWAVAKCGGGGNFPASFKQAHENGMSNYSTNWAQGGPIIEREKIETSPAQGAWRATPDRECYSDRAAPWFFGPTPLIAAMRCYVASKLGDEVEIPKELA
jgi:hypothetical protein